MTTFRVQLDLWHKFVKRPWTTFSATLSATIFLYFNSRAWDRLPKKLPIVKKITRKQNNFVQLSYSAQNNYLSLWTVWYWEENIYNQFEIISFITVLLSIPLNKLPWHSPRKPTRTTTVQSRNTSTTPRSSSVPALGPPNGFSDKTKVRKMVLFYFVLVHCTMFLRRCECCKLRKNREIGCIKKSSICNSQINNEFLR